MNTDEFHECPAPPSERTMFLGEKTPGHNLDAIDVPSGMKELIACGYDDSPETTMVIEYALLRHKRGEESAAERGAIDKNFHGISFTCWRRVLAAAMAGASVK